MHLLAGPGPLSTRTHLQAVLCITVPNPRLWSRRWARRPPCGGCWGRPCLFWLPGLGGEMQARAKAGNAAGTLLGWGGWGVTQESSGGGPGVRVRVGVGRVWGGAQQSSHLPPSSFCLVNNSKPEVWVLLSRMVLALARLCSNPGYATY